MMKKLLSAVLAIVMTLSMTVVTASAAEKKYTDTDGHWAEKAIEQWSDYGIVQGSNNAFRPDAKMTRGEFAVAMSNLLGLTNVSPTKFQDLKGNEWYADAIRKLFAAGIMSGDEKGNCKPNDRITREEAFVMLGRALGVTPVEEDAFGGFNDGKKVSKWARPIMAALVKGGFVHGTTNTLLSPLKRIDRASVMQVLTNTVTTYVTEPGNYTVSGKGFTVVKTEGDVTLTGKTEGIVITQESKGAEITVESAVVAGTVKVDAPDVTLQVKDSNLEGKVEVTDAANNAKLEVDAGSTVEAVTTEANNVQVTGDGKVKEVETAGGRADISTPGTLVTVPEDAQGATATVGGNEVKPGESSTNSGSGQGYQEEPIVPGVPSAPSTPSTPEPPAETYEATLTESDFTTATSDFVSTYYNQSNPHGWSQAQWLGGKDPDNGHAAEIDLGSLTNITSVKLGSRELKDCYKAISVGNNNWVYSQLCRVDEENHKLKISLILIATESPVDGTLTFTITCDQGVKTATLHVPEMTSGLAFSAIRAKYPNVTTVSGTTITRTTNSSEDSMVFVGFTGGNLDANTVYFTKKDKGNGEDGISYGMTPSDGGANVGEIGMYVNFDGSTPTNLTYTVCTSNRYGPASVSMTVNPPTAP